MKTTGKRRCFLERKFSGDRAYISAARDRLGGETEYCEAKDVIARFHVSECPILFP
jgi:hypothetical protein